MEVCGIPPASLVDKCRKKDHYFDVDFSPFLIEDEEQGILRIPDSRTLEQSIVTDDLAFIDFIKKCLVLDPDERFSASEAIKHPWFADYVTKFEDQKPDTAREVSSSNDSEEKRAAPEESEFEGLQRPFTHMSQ